MKQEDVIRIRDQIILSVLPEVTFEGWIWENIQNAAMNYGFNPAVVNAVFPDRMIDVLDGFADLADRKMFENISTINIQDLRISDRINFALCARYEWLQAHKEAVRKSLCFWAFPTRKPKAAKIIWRTADRIWLWAGDTSKDYNHYTKRMLLVAVIVPTTLAWLSDDSQDMSETRAFLSRRIENVLKLGKMVSSLKSANKKANA